MLIISNLTEPCQMDLDTSLIEAKLAVNYFFNNKFVEAKQLMQPW